MNRIWLPAALTLGLVAACSQATERTAPLPPPAPEPGATSGPSAGPTAGTAPTAGAAPAAPVASLPPSLALAGPYSPDRGATDDPGLKAFCSEAAPTLPPRTRLTKPEPTEAVRLGFRTRVRLVEQPASEILALAPERTTREDLGDLLFAVGQRHAKDKSDVLAIQYWDCAARRYADTKSMLKLAMIAFNGPRPGEPPLPGVGAAPDFAAAYFWVTSAAFLDGCDGGRDAIALSGQKLLTELRTKDPHATEQKPLDHAQVEAEAAGYAKAVAPTCTPRAVPTK